MYKDSRGPTFSKLDEIKDKIKDCWQTEKDNYKRYNEAIRFIFETTLSDNQAQILNIVQKPKVEFNVLTNSINRICSDFAAHSPDIEVSSSAGQKAEISLISFLEGHYRYILEEANDKNNLAYCTIRESLSGGFSVMEVDVNYANSHSFDLQISVNKKPDPTLIGFDPLCRLPNKSDAKYCFEVVPMTEEEAKVHGFDTSKMDFRLLGGGNTKGAMSGAFSGYTWSFQDYDKKIVLLCYFFEKQEKKTKLVKLSDGQEMIIQDYNRLLKTYEEEFIIEAPPIIVDSRETIITSIKRYFLSGNQILEEAEMPFSHLPFVYVDGNSVDLKAGTSQSNRRLIRSYVKDAMDAQRGKNFAGQTLLGEIENISQWTVMSSKEAVPAEYLNFWTNNQVPSVLLYNQFYKDNPEYPLTPPQVVQRQAIPAEIANTFNSMDQTIQMILGNLNSDLAHLAKEPFSGRAIQEVLSLANSSAMPYIINYMNALTQVGNIILEIIPRIYTTPLSVPYKEKDGKLGYVLVNSPQKGQQGPQPDLDLSQQNQQEPTQELQAVNIQYDSKTLKISVKAGVNFAMQQSKAVETMTALAKAIPTFGEFITGSSQGLEAVLENINIRGIDKLKKDAVNFVKKKEAERNAELQAAQQQQQNNPLIQKLQIENTKIQQQAEQFATQSQLKIAELEQRRLEKEQEYALELEKLKNERLRMMAELAESEEHSKVQLIKADTERYNASIEAASKHADHEHKLAERLDKAQERLQKRAEQSTIE